MAYVAPFKCSKLTHAVWVIILSANIVCLPKAFAKSIAYKCLNKEQITYQQLPCTEKNTKIQIINLISSGKASKVKILSYHPQLKTTYSKPKKTTRLKSYQHDKCAKYTMQLKQLYAKLTKGYTLKESEPLKIKIQFLKQQKQYYCD